MPRVRLEKVMPFTFHSCSAVCPYRQMGPSTIWGKKDMNNPSRNRFSSDLMVSRYTSNM